MASPTRVTDMRRKRKTRNAGRPRKTALNRQGTTRSERDLFGNELGQKG